MLSLYTDWPCKAANVSKTLGASVMPVTVDLIYFLVSNCARVQKIAEQFCSCEFTSFASWIIQEQASVIRPKHFLKTG